MNNRENYVRKERASFVGEGKSSKNSSQRRSHLPVFAVGNDIEVTIKEIGKQGDGIGYTDGCTIIVPNANINETVKVKIEKAINTNTFKAKRLGEINKTKVFR
ncbi:TRAM domain-containing protein [Candidatus Woesearchaeota archaeon]|nr:TRAM domain-containing protein [Candidatus Woesearchaeota archaeon]